MLFKKIFTPFISLALVLSNLIPVSAIDVYLGGQSIGIVLNYQGVMITGAYEINYKGKAYNPLSDYKQYDMIVEANNQKISSIQDLSSFISDGNETLQTTVIRNTKRVNVEMKISNNENHYTTGLYVKDCLRGIGTVTYINPKNNTYASLGHSLLDETNIAFHNGEIFQSSIEGIKKSTALEVGKKIGTIQDQSLGTVNKNSSFGIYGQYNGTLNEDVYQTASQKEIELGNAYFLTVIDENQISKVAIKITELKKQNQPQEKGIVFRLTDNQVLQKTNGIIQGMSGSPIIQNNKLIGCVTHADHENNVIGYGMYIDWMIEDEKKK